MSRRFYNVDSRSIQTLLVVRSERDFLLQRFFASDELRPVQPGCFTDKTLREEKEGFSSQSGYPIGDRSNAQLTPLPDLQMFRICRRTSDNGVWFGEIRFDCPTFRRY